MPKRGELRETNLLPTVYATVATPNTEFYEPLAGASCWEMSIQPTQSISTVDNSVKLFHLWKIFFVAIKVIGNALDKPAME